MGPVSNHGASLRDYGITSGSVLLVEPSLARSEATVSSDDVRLGNRRNGRRLRKRKRGSAASYGGGQSLWPAGTTWSTGTIVLGDG